MQKVGNQRRSASANPLLRSPIEGRPEIHQITLPLPPTWRTLDRVHVYLIEGDPLTLIDTGVRSVESRAVLEGALESLGYDLREVERVVVTHAHRDHMGLVQSLRDAGATLECLVHEDDADALERYPELVRERIDDTTLLFREYGVPEDRLVALQRDARTHLALDDAEGQASSVEHRLRAGDRLPFKGYTLKVVHSPGHTPGHILLEDDEQGLLFTGDQVMGQAIPNTETFYTGPIPEPDDRLNRRPRFKGLIEMRRSLKSLRQRRFKRLLPAYGGIITRPDRTIRDTLLFYEVRLQRIERGLKHLAAMGQEVTAFELWKSLFPANESMGDMRTHLLNLIGALDCLEAEGHLVVARRSDGVLTHHHR